LDQRSAAAFELAMPGWAILTHYAIKPGCAFNCVVVLYGPDKDEDDNEKFIHVPTSCQGGFDLIHNGNNFLSL
jgi:hypothetical protein